jgi:hypothetical protein
MDCRHALLKSPATPDRRALRRSRASVVHFASSSLVALAACGAACIVGSVFFFCWFCFAIGRPPKSTYSKKRRRKKKKKKPLIFVGFFFRNTRGETIFFPLESVRETNAPRRTAGKRGPPARYDGRTDEWARTFRPARGIDAPLADARVRFRFFFFFFFDFMFISSSRMNVGFYLFIICLPSKCTGRRLCRHPPRTLEWACRLDPWGPCREVYRRRRVYRCPRRAGCGCRFPRRAA